MAVYKIVVRRCKCERCGHEWLPRKKIIMICPHCKSPYWNRARKKKSKR